MNPVKIDGEAVSWSSEQADRHRDRLQERGFYAKTIPTENTYVVAYCYRPFTRQEIEDLLETLTQKRNQPK